jgi:hypothetical protein
MLLWHVTSSMQLQVWVQACAHGMLYIYAMLSSRYAGAASQGVPAPARQPVLLGPPATLAVGACFGTSILIVGQLALAEWSNGRWLCGHACWNWVSVLSYVLCAPRGGCA